VAYAKGRELVTNQKLEQSPKTNRVVATCCNSALMMTFDDARHWIPVYRARLGPNAPAIERRICTSFLLPGTALPSDIPVHRPYPPAFLLKLLAAGGAMLIARSPMKRRSVSE